MLGDHPLTAFLATSDPERARHFFADTLGLRLAEEDPFALVFGTPSAPLRIQKVERVTPHPYTALGWHVRGIREIVAALAAKGVVFERYPFLEQDQHGLWLAPSGTSVAWFKDPDGNLLSLSESAGA